MAEESIIELAPSLDGAPKVELTKEQLDTIAATALALAQRDVGTAGVRPERMLRPYQEQSEQKRADQRAGVYRVVQALIMHGYIDHP